MTNLDEKPRDPTDVRSGSSLIRIRKSIVGIALDNATKIILIPIAAALFWAVWVVLDSHIRTYLTAVFSAELAKENSQLLEIFKSTLYRLRQSEAGAVSAGSFYLTPTNRSYDLYLYFPDGYKGSISYRVTRNSAPNCQHVILLRPAADPIPLEREATILLEQVFTRTSEQAKQLNDIDIFERPPLTKSFRQNLRAITFQLEDLDSSGPRLASSHCTTEALGGPRHEPVAGIEVSYVSLIAPSIHMAQ